ncbi:hypothetical protein MH1LPH_21100 [Lactiplantibacillus brownii]
MCGVDEINRRSWLTNLTGQFKDVFCRLGIEASDRTLAGAVPHSTPILTDGALNLGKSILGLWVTDTTTFVVLLSLSTFRFIAKNEKATKCSLPNY